MGDRRRARLGPRGRRVHGPYARNRQQAREIAFDAAAVATAIERMLELRPDHTWTGTAAQLLDALDDYVGPATRRSSGWPNTPQKLGNELRVLEQTLRAAGVTVTFRRQARRRLIELVRVEPPDPGTEADPEG